MFSFRSNTWSGTGTWGYKFQIDDWFNALPKGDKIQANWVVSISTLLNRFTCSDFETKRLRPTRSQPISGCDSNSIGDRTEPRILDGFLFFFSIFQGFLYFFTCFCAKNSKISLVFSIRLKFHSQLKIKYVLHFSLQLGNHDNGRIASKYRPSRVDLYNIFLKTLPGIAVTYYVSGKFGHFSSSFRIFIISFQPNARCSI